MSQLKKRIAVFFGGRSPEHDVSIVTGLQALRAVDPGAYDAFPVYITPEGVWLTGDVLRERASYMLDKNALGKTQEVTLDVTAGRAGRLLPKNPRLLAKAKPIIFDVALPCFHGSFGEDGSVQGLFEIAGVPYAGMRVMAASLLMDKAATKKILQGLDIPVLPYAVLKRPAQGTLIPKAKIESAMRSAHIGYPCIVKPSHLGSSIGVAKTNEVQEIASCLPGVFEYDDCAIIEPFVSNLVEYNVAVSRISGKTQTSAIERPKSSSELLDFKQKYLSGANKSGTKTSAPSSEGMLSLTREINPLLDGEKEKNIRLWASQLFDAVNGTGTPRVDFLGNAESGEIWFNEVNPWPGSCAYFLWEAASEPLLFTELLTGLIEEAITESRRRLLPSDPVPAEARLFKRSL
ncbi:MAG: D-alanine--D-alanine ligase [Alphaproteobacteria bacterium]